MFFVPEINVIESGNGFRVKVLGRTGLLSTEGDRSVTIDSEVLAGSAGLAVYANSFHGWNHPHHKSRFGEDDRENIIGDIRDAFKFGGFDFAII